ncbi:MAG: DUF1080 domain-containing protein [Planctomycetes bacterium]|nr:DUF1080 domain-containing protein [Planctomycetota bacterium]
MAYRSIALVIIAFLFFGDLLAADKLRALILDGQNNHEWPKTTPILRSILEYSGRFTVDVVTSPRSGESLDSFRPDFSKYNVVVSNYNGDLWPESVRTAFAKYVEDGGGFVSVHAANNAFPEWAEYNEMIGVGGWKGRDEESGPYLRLRGGKFVRDESTGRGGHHGTQHDFVMETRDPDHPIMRGLPPRWMHAKDELYDSLRGPAKNLTVLGSALSTKETNGSGEHEPLLMAIHYGNGRVFHTAVGHSPHAMTCVGFHVTLARGAEWAATRNVTLTKLPHDFPTADMPSRRYLPAKPDAEGWVKLFNGKDLSGWRQVNGTAKYSVEDGVIVGTTNEGSPNSFLCTTNYYGNFELKLEVKVDTQLNSGIQIRSNSFRGFRDYRVHGYQVEIATNGTAGYIWDEAGNRGWLTKNRNDPAARAAFKDGEWNRYRVIFQGDSLKTWVNDVSVANIKDDVTAAGFIGLQVHGIKRGTGPYQVRWRNLVLREL